LVHLLVIYNHVTIPGTSGGHKFTPNGSADICGDKLTEGIDRTKTGTRFSGTFENQGGDGDVDTRFDVTSKESGERAGVNEKWAAGRIVEARGNRGRIDRASGASRWFWSRTVEGTRPDEVRGKRGRFWVGYGGIVDTGRSDGRGWAGRAGLCKVGPYWGGWKRASRWAGRWRGDRDGPEAEIFLHAASELFEDSELIGYVIWRLYMVWITFWMTISRERGG
jgi:hypothetical protein